MTTVLFAARANDSASLKSAGNFRFRLLVAMMPINWDIIPSARPYIEDHSRTHLQHPSAISVGWHLENHEL